MENFAPKALKIFNNEGNIPTIKIVSIDKSIGLPKNINNINNFININKLLDEKNRELESLVSGSQKLQYSQHEMEKKVDFYLLNSLL